MTNSISYENKSFVFNYSGVALSSMGSTAMYSGTQGSLRIQRKSLYQLGHIQRDSPFIILERFHVSPITVVTVMSFIY